jgi:hypothetical protein
MLRSLHFTVREDLRFANEMYDICSASKRAPACNLQYSRKFLYLVLMRPADSVACGEMAED